MTTADRPPVSGEPPRYGDRFDNWRRPIVDGLYLYVCPTCSALTDEPWAHEQWHHRLTSKEERP